MAKRQVSYAKLHGTDGFIPGVGNIGTVLDASNNFIAGKTVNMTLYYTELGLEYTISRNGKTFEGVFPAANVQVAVYTESTPINKNVLDFKAS